MSVKRVMNTIFFRIHIIISSFQILSAVLNKSPAFNLLSVAHAVIFHLQWRIDYARGAE